MKLDTTGKGLGAVFKEYQLSLIELLSQRDLTSGEGHAFIVEHGIRTTGKARGPVSRATVILFLNSLVDEGLVNYTEKTGKGGYARVYKKIDKQEFLERIMERFVSKLNEINQMETTGLFLRLK